MTMHDEASESMPGTESNSRDDSPSLQVAPKHVAPYRPRITKQLRFVPGIIVLLLVLLAPLAFDAYLVFLANFVLVYVIIGMGLNLILGWTGQFAFTSVTFFGLGAYTGTRVAALLNLPLEFALLIGALAGLFVGLGFGALAVRLKGYYLSIVTIASLFILTYVYENFPSLTGGVRGFAVPAPRLLVLGGREIASDYGKYYIGLVLVVLVYGLVFYLRKTSLGRAWQVVRVDERVAAALGVNVYRNKLAAFAVSAAIFSFVGAWFPYLNRRVFPESYNLDELIFHFLIIVIGGMGSMNGVVIGAVLLVVADEFLRGFVGLSEILFGLALLLTVLFLPGGIYGTLVDKFPRIREGMV